MKLWWKHSPAPLFACEWNRFQERFNQQKRFVEWLNGRCQKMVNFFVLCQKPNIGCYSSDFDKPPLKRSKKGLRPCPVSNRWPLAPPSINVSCEEMEAMDQVIITQITSSVRWERWGSSAAGTHSQWIRTIWVGVIQPAGRCATSTCFCIQWRGQCATRISCKVGLQEPNSHSIISLEIFDCWTVSHS